MMVGGVATIGGAVGLTFVTVGQYRKAAAAYNSAAGLACVPRREITLAFGTAPGGIGMRLAF
ncbi:MAG: hypothetical protein LBU98_03985, partial [Alistipes sp.]|jgi:hypothetical protein|nr:hypothetical protein [Alistipes sp.]